MSWKSTWRVSGYSRSRLFSWARSEGRSAEQADRTSHAPGKDAQTSRWRLRQRPRCPRKGGWLGDRIRCPQHHTSACTPSEPPSLACPTWRGMAAEKGGPSLWWARASGLASRALSHIGDLFRVSAELDPSRGHGWYLRSKWNLHQHGVTWTGVVLREPAGSETNRMVYGKCRSSQFNCPSTCRHTHQSRMGRPKGLAGRSTQVVETRRLFQQRRPR